MMVFLVAWFGQAYRGTNEQDCCGHCAIRKNGRTKRRIGKDRKENKPACIRTYVHFPGSILVRQRSTVSVRALRYRKRG